MTDRSVSLKNYSVGGYSPGSFIKRFLWIFVSRIFFETRFPFPSAFKACLLRIFGATVGSQVVIKQSVLIKYPWFLSIGDYCWLGQNVWIDNLCSVYIENNCCISQSAYLLTGNHDYSRDTFDLIVKPIKLEQGSWVGARSIVCPGVTLGKNAVLSVGSVASRDCRKSGVYQGNPAVFKKERLIQ